MDKKARIALVGDVYLGDDPSLSLADDVAAIFREADLVIANQEGPITVRTNGLSEKTLLRSSPASAERLRAWGVDVASLANNHIFDFGWEGFADTRAALDAVGVRHLGAGENLEEATQPLVLSAGDMTIGLLAYSWGFIETRCATETEFGCAPLDEQLMLEQTRRLSERTDAVIVLPHWGYCNYTLPIPEQLTLGRKLLDAGAAAVVAGHAHVVQGAVEHNGRILACNLGNFAFAQYVSRGKIVTERSGLPEYFRGVVLEIDIAAGRVNGHRLIPTVQREQVIERDESPARRRDFNRRSAALDHPDYPRVWKRYLRMRMLQRLLHWVNPMNWRQVGKHTIKGMWIMLRGGKGLDDRAAIGR